MNLFHIRVTYQQTFTYWNSVIKIMQTSLPERIRTLFSTLLLGIATIGATIGASSSSFAQSLEVPIIERAQDDLDTCSFGQVARLKAGGDGFLAVRTGPGSKFRKIDEIHNGDDVWLFDQRGAWIGVVYGVSEVNCSPIKQNRPVPHIGEKGWVHEKWIDVIAG